MNYGRKREKERTVIHLYIKENDTHHYFGSIANVFEYFSPNILGISYGSLRNYGLSNEKLFKTQSASFEKEPFCQNREIGAKNK